MRFAILAAVIVLLLLVLVAAAAFLFTYRAVPIARPVPMTQSVAVGSDVADPAPTSAGVGGVQFSAGSVEAKIWRAGKRVLFEVDGSGVEIELGAEDGTFDFAKLRENFDALDRSFSPAGGALQEIVLEVGERVPDGAVSELARIAKSRGMRGIKVGGAFVSPEKED